MAVRQRELRKARRRPKRQAAWISYEGSDALVPCVIWDLSEDGARLGPARSKGLPEEFTLLMSKDGSSRRLCRVAWRKDRHIGVQFLPSNESEDAWPVPRGRSRRPVAAPPYEPLSPDRLACVSNSLALSLPPAPVRRSSKIAGRYASSGLAFGFVILLTAATAVFYVAGLEIENGTPWALELCGTAKNLCNHPEMSGVPALLLAVVCFALKGLESET
jgi:hypothetical protein